MKKIKEENWYSNQKEIKELFENIEIIQKTLNNYYSMIIKPLKEELDLSSGQELYDIKNNYNNLYKEYIKYMDIANNLNNEIDKITRRYDNLYLENKNKKDKSYNEHLGTIISDGKNKKQTKSYSEIIDTYINSDDGEIYNTVSKKSILITNGIGNDPMELSVKDEKIS